MSTQNDEDLFQSSTMTFGEHLEELRTCLIRAIGWLLAGSAFGLYFGYDVVQVITMPLEAALVEFYLDHDVKEMKERIDALQLEGQDVPDYAFVESLIRRERMVPQIHYADPYSIAHGLAEATGGPGALSAALREEVLKNDDFENASGESTFEQFCKTIHEEYESDEPSAGKRIGDSLAAADCLSTLAHLKAIADGKESTKEQRKRIIEDLNRILGDRGFYQKEELGSLVEKPSLGMTDPNLSLRTLLNERLDDLPDYEVTRVNRWLLTIAYGDVLKPYHRKDSMVRYLQWVPLEDDRRVRIISLSAHEMFIIYIKAALVFGAVIACPFIFYHIWEFVAAGLYPHERKQVYVFLPISIGLFLSGAALAFFFVFQPVLQFLLMFNREMGI
ncbi:MAG: twin-arginine translocase subunit TatC, partial [Planctomycetales bacterium]